MHSRSWSLCLAQDPVTGAWCQSRPSQGVFCAPHAAEFCRDEAAKAATRLLRARLEVWDPSTPPLRRWLASVRIRRARSLRRNLLERVAIADGDDLDLSDQSEDFMLPEDFNTWR